MTEAEFIEQIVAAGLVVLDDDEGYHICKQYDKNTTLATLSRQTVEAADQESIAYMLANIDSMASRPVQAQERHLGLRELITFIKITFLIGPRTAWRLLSAAREQRKQGRKVYMISARVRHDE